MTDLSATPNYWIKNNPEFLGNDVGGLRNPDRVSALVIDGFTTSDGEEFDSPPFARGTLSAIFAVVDADIAQKAFEGVERYMKSKKGLQENLRECNEGLIATWNLTEGKVAIMVGDGSTEPFFQNNFEQILSLHKVRLYSSEHAVMDPEFDALRLTRDENRVFSDELVQVIEGFASPVVVEPVAKTSRSLKL